MIMLSRRQLLSVTAGGVVGLAGGVPPARGAQVVAEPPPPAKPASKPVKGPYADGILTPGEPPPPVAGAFTFVVLPDTQNYAVVLLTHVYVYFDDTRYDWARYGTRQQWNPHTYGMAKASQGDVHDGEQLWQNLVSKHRNVIMTFNGHVLGDGLGRVTTAAFGRDISQQLVNFQMRPNGGDGWLRLVEMRPDGTAHTWDYSPVLGSRNESPQNQFAFNVAKIG